MIVSTPRSWLLSSWDIVKLLLAVLKSRLGNLCTCFWDGNLWAGFSTVAPGVEGGMKRTEIHCKAHPRWEMYYMIVLQIGYSYSSCNWRRLYILLLNARMLSEWYRMSLCGVRTVKNMPSFHHFLHFLPSWFEAFSVFVEQYLSLVICLTKVQVGYTQVL